LVTGGTGFIGTYLCKRLIETGHSVNVLDLFEPDSDLRSINFIKGDVRNPNAMRAAMEDCTAVFHLAAAHHDFGIQRETYFSVNEIGSQVVCDTMDLYGIKRACFYSSVAVYGDAPDPHHEECVKLPTTAYGQSKLTAEEVFRRWANQGQGRKALVIRPTNTFGPHNFANMYALIRQIYLRRFIPVGNGQNVKSICYVENLVNASLCLWGYSDQPFDVYNYVDKPDLTSNQISEAIYVALERRVPQLRIPLWLALVLGLPFDIISTFTGLNLPVSTQRIRKFADTQTRFEVEKLLKTGFQPEVSLTEGIRRMVEWYETNGRHQPPIYRLPPNEVAF
jgi:nucleoside-diphosphate-sugar epimerase